MDISSRSDDTVVCPAVRRNDFLLTNIVLAAIITMLVVTAALVAYCQSKIEAERRTSLEDLATKLNYMYAHQRGGKHRGPYTTIELKEWQRRKRRLERVARRKRENETDPMMDLLTGGPVPLPVPGLVRRYGM